MILQGYIKWHKMFATDIQLNKQFAIAPIQYVVVLSLKYIACNKKFSFPLSWKINCYEIQDNRIGLFYTWRSEVFLVWHFTRSLHSLSNVLKFYGLGLLHSFLIRKCTDQYKRHVKHVDAGQKEHLPTSPQSKLFKKHTKNCNMTLALKNLCEDNFIARII